MAYGRVARFEPIREIGPGAIGAAYLPVGGQTLDYTRLFTLTNETDVDVYISLDGVTDQLRVVSGSSKVFDVSTNKVRDDGLFLPKGTIFYIRRVGAVATTGSFSIEVMYASGGV
jgi:hypothetical protein